MNVIVDTQQYKQKNSKSFSSLQYVHIYEYCFPFWLFLTDEINSILKEFKKKYVHG